MRSFVLEGIEGNSVFDFRAGQFVTFDLPISERKSQRLRSYSIASDPQQRGRIELLIALVEDGDGSSYFFYHTQVGTELVYRGPQGVFVLPEDSVDKDLYFICTGVGIAPFLSMLLEIMAQGKKYARPIYLIYGCRTKQDMIYEATFRKMEATYANFTYIPVLSREQWEGKNGYVHEVYEGLLQHNQRPSDFFICGWRPMVDEAVARLGAMGYDKSAIHIELYG